MTLRPTGHGTRRSLGSFKVFCLCLQSLKYATQINIVMSDARCLRPARYSERCPGLAMKPDEACMVPELLEMVAVH